MKIIQVNYNRDITDNLVTLWYARFSTLPTEAFVYALSAHIDDPDEGRFFPTVAHVLKHIIGTEADAEARYGIAFDDDPGCDGLPTFDQQRETIPQRAGRRKIWVEQNLARWRTASADQKIQHALNQKSLQRKLENTHARLN